MVFSHQSHELCASPIGGARHQQQQRGSLHIDGALHFCTRRRCRRCSASRRMRHTAGEQTCGRWQQRGTLLASGIPCAVSWRGIPDTARTHHRCGEPCAEAAEAAQLHTQLRNHASSAASCRARLQVAGRQEGRSCCGGRPRWIGEQSRPSHTARQYQQEGLREGAARGRCGDAAQSQCR